MNVTQAYLDAQACLEASLSLSPPLSPLPPPSAASPSASDNTEDASDAGRARREQNRIASRRSRDKRKALLAAVNAVVDTQSAAIQSLEAKIGVLEDVLRKYIADLEIDQCEREGEGTTEEVVGDSEWVMEEVHGEGYVCAKEKNDDVVLLDSELMGGANCLVDAMWEEDIIAHEIAVDRFLSGVSSAFMFEDWL